MKKCGFTLIELLAVIVVLAIITLIAVPIVLNIVNKAKEGAAAQSAVVYIKSVENYMVLSELNPNKYPIKLESGKSYQISDDEFEFGYSNNIIPLMENVYADSDIDVVANVYLNDYIEYKGKLPNKGIINIGEDNKVSSATMAINGYMADCTEYMCEIVGKSGTTVVSVKSVKINDKSVTSLSIGDTLTLSATILPDNASNKEVLWKSSDESVATVDENGMITGIKEGNVTITVLSGRKSDSLDLIITKRKLIMEKPNIGDTHKGIIYLDPTNLSKICTKNDVDANINSNGFSTGIKDGCMRWFVYDDSDDHYRLILDHNTTARIKWNDSNKNVPYEESNLYSVVQDLIKISGWQVNSETDPENSIEELTIISAEEINNIVGGVSTFDPKNFYTWFYFESTNYASTKLKYTDSLRSKYAWLYNNLGLCKTDSNDDYGCTIEDSNEYVGYGTAGNGLTMTYWTKTPVNLSYVWRVTRSGSLNVDDANAGNNGIRPVIVISKNIVSK